MESDCRTGRIFDRAAWWERVSDVSNVVFTNGAIADDDGKVYIYYAASDTRLHVASTTIGQLLDFAFKKTADPCLPLPGDYGQVPAKLWYLHKV